ncbi:Flagellar motor switch protein FliN [Euzebya pacifica]|uniref:Flagellar motor switch protein FliN n=1 Tax=Euzebya pacifica TaxID=1608957 RepID=A0A346XUG4_9ACTN|nr:flagellar motor switch protein FliN [Euzebya pacifica]AXV05861.1 Flagellar motor switch protein FliN [Euzebya pacifica]
MSETLLEATVAAVVRRIGGRLPAAYTLDPQDLRIGGDADHTLPDGGTTVRWALGTDDGHLVVAITADAAEMLAAEGPLVDVMTARVEAAAIDLAIAFGGIPPMLGEGVEVDPSTAFEGPTGEPVSVLLDDAGVHRATIGLRLELTDALMGPVPEDLPEFDLGPFPGDDEPTVDAEDVPASSGDGVTPMTQPGQPQPGQPQPGQTQPASPHAQPQTGPGLVTAASRGQGRAPGRGPMDVPTGQAHPADFSSFDQLSALPGQGQSSMSLLGDVEMGVTAELGRTQLTVRDVLNLTPGSIVELDRAAGSPVDVVVNGTLIARGEVVVIDEEFGIRITEILGAVEQATPFPMAQ